MGRASVVRAETKARTDSLKSKLYCQFGKKIIMAVKAGGGKDPIKNRLLSQVIEDAKAANVPKEIITRNMEKGEQSSTVDFKETIFEFYGHGGIGILVNVYSDNENRVSQDLHLIAKKNQLKVATINSVRFKFQRKARIDVKPSTTTSTPTNTFKIDDDWLMNYCLEHGIDDYELKTIADGNLLSPKIDGQSSIYVDIKDMVILRTALRETGAIVETSLAHIPLEGLIGVSDEDFNANVAAIHAFEDLDDVDFVEHNMELT